MFFIASGVVEILSDDNLRVLARFHDGQFFGEIAVLLDVPRIANVKAVSQVEVFVLTKDNLEAVFEAVPGAAETITAEGHRLYQNWLIKNSQQKREQATDDDESLQGMEAELNYESLNVPRRLSVPILQSKEGNVAAVSAMQGTDQQGSPPRLSPKLSPMSIHPIEAGHPAAISVLPMAPMDEYLLGNRITASPPATTSPPTDLEGGPFNEHALAPAHAQESQPVSKESFFDQDMGTAPTLENQQEPPTSRNPTIRGLQQSNPKRRRASVAVWTQQDLLKLAESAEAKASISTTHAPATASAMATSLLPTAATDDTQKKDAAEKSAQAKRSSRIPFVNKSPIKKLTGPATFQDLDESIVIQILNGLPLNRLLRVRSVCKSWNKLILEHNSILRDVDLSKHKKIVTDTLLKELCDTILSRNPTRTTRISLRDCFLISDKGLAMLATHMPAVQDLDLHSCWNVTDAGFRLLGVHCSQLRSIDFSNCRKLGDETIFGLYPKEAMTVANVLPKEGLVDAVLGPQAVAHPELKDMVEQDPLSADTSMDEAQVQLKHRPSIETESAQETQTTMDIEPPNHTAELPSKQPATTASQAAAPGPKGCPLLARLNLSYCKNLTDRSFIHLSLYGSKQLEYLNLQRCTTITSEAFMSLDLESKGAVHEDIMTNGHGNDVEIPTHEGYNPLVEPCFPQLRELHLSDCTFLTDDAIIALAPNMPRIEVVSLSFCCALTDVAVEAMCGSCSFLKKLDLSFCGSAVSDASLYQLARFDALEPGRHSLRELEIRGCVRVTERGVREVLNGCANMTKLNISSCSGIGTGDLSAPVPEQTLVSGDQAGPGEDVSMSPALQSAPQAEAQEQSDTAENTNVIGGSTKSWESLPNPTQSGELARKMDALKKGKEWALAQQRPGLKIIV
ncbi:hypothetical protein BC939DRAFT_10632 [Gamsiella multidivaricata]|uniref:uncharacterized protein n=1 Tax=Gamsiella multidivaricata TaxID=101098 RepID=UPI00221F3632|nr:uncharacterized protein BC939DRAFT_10632 [Gamsiella multidivaricata]KAI7829540.1 hypothetical protein BC939DRAFT_10632 [Gamsiella multidivaricata]